MAPPRVILIGFDEDVLESRAVQEGWPACEIVRLATGAAALEHAHGDTDVAVAVATSAVNDMAGVEVLHRLAAEAPAVRRILATPQLTEEVRQALAGGQIHATAPMDDQVLLAAAVHDALQRNALEAHARDAETRLRSRDSELTQLRSELEHKVAERTDQLELKIRELEGRNRIAKHLMRVHTMEGTLEEVLKVLSQTLRLERAVIHLADGDRLHPSAAIRLHDQEKEPEVYDPGEVESAAVVRQTLEIARKSRQSQNVTDPQAPFVSPFAVVPILRDDELLGLIEVENFRSQRHLALK